MSDAEGLPRNFDAERSILGAILLGADEALPLVTPILGEEDFFTDSHRHIYRAAIELSKRSAPVDLVTVAEQLSKNGGIDAGGGHGYIATLLDGVPEVAHIKHYAYMVKEKAALRRLVAMGQRLVRDALASDPPPIDAIIAGATRELSSVATEAAESRGVTSWRDLPKIVDVLDAMPPPGDRLRTGIPTLDECSRGGFARGRLYVVLGPPGKGKTTFSKSVAQRFARLYGAIVICLFYDEGAWPAAIMLTQGAGFRRSDIEDSYSKIRGEIALATDQLDIRLPSPDSPETLLDAVERWIPPEDAAARPIVILADSVQTIRCTKGFDASTAKERADAVMETAQRLARRLNAIVLLTSKANRGSWANKNPTDNVHALAAGLDSSSIEYFADAMFFFEGDPEKGSYIQVLKNRPGDGTKPRIPLAFDRDRAEFREVDSVAAQDEKKGQSDARREEASSRAQEAILRAIDKHPAQKGCPGLSETFLAGRVRLNKTRQAFRDAIDALVDGQTILEAVEGPRSGTYYRRRVDP